jgi:DNA-binding transcriptional LysR family regulator
MDRLEAMSVLLTVVKTGSFSAASRKLGVPVANVSRKISELEQHLKTGILIRSSRRMTLTDAGRSYVEACKRILENVEEAERAATGEYSEPRGNLTVTAPVSFGRLHLLPVALEFLAAYPDIDIRLALSDRHLDLLEDNVALAIRIGNLADSSQVATRIGSTRIVVCASPTYLAARGRPEKPEDLRDHDCITFDNLASPEAWRFVDAKGDILVPVRSRLTVSTAEAAIDAAIAGLGVLRMMSYKIEDARQAGALEIVLPAFEPAPWAVSLLYPGQGPLPLKLRAFLNFATPRLRARLA